MSFLSKALVLLTKGGFLTRSEVTSNVFPQQGIGATNKGRILNQVRGH